MLNGAVVFGIALAAGGPPTTAARLGLAMTCLQVAIGALNDIVDAPDDAGHVPVKAIPAGLVSIAHARWVVVVGAAVGLGLAAPSGLATLLIAAAGLACGLTYDLFLSRSAISWLPLAVALPLVPAFAWLGATANLPSTLLAILPLAALAGGGLAIGNSLVDLEADHSSGRRTTAVVLGRLNAWRLHAVVLGSAALLALGLLPPGTSATPETLAVIGAFALATGIALGRANDAGRRRVAWQIEAIGVASIGIGWIAGASPL